MSLAMYDVLQPSFNKLKDDVKRLVSAWDIKLVDRAFELAALGHSHQTRQSGEAYIYHPLEVARIVAELQCDCTTFIAAILHDVAEDTNITLAQIAQEFGEEVASIVDAVTKIQIAPLQDSSAALELPNHESLRKVLVGTTKDLRVAYIKLADRLHNLMTLGGRPPARRVRTIEETLSYFGPFARELGIANLHNRLVWEALRHGDATNLDRLAAIIRYRQDELGQVENRIWRTLDVRLRNLGIVADKIETPLQQIVVNLLDREFLSWQEFSDKILHQKSTFSLLAVAPILLLFDTGENRYSALKAIHSLGLPIYSRFGDWATCPQVSGYTGVYTSVLVSLEREQLIVFKLQTKQEYKTSQVGPLYDLCHSANYQDAYQHSTQAEILRRIAVANNTIKDTVRFLEYLRMEVLRPKIRIFTAEGECVTIPMGATVLDLAYVLHREQGYQCVRAVVNNSSKQIQTTLYDGDIVELVMESQKTLYSSQWTYGKEFTLLSTKDAVEQAR